MIYFFDLFGVAVFAVSGALAAVRKRMDLFGVLVLAVVTAIGGGTLRDLLLAQGPVFWIGDPAYVLLAAGAGFVTVVLGRWHVPRHQVLLLADAFGLAFFCVIGAQKAVVAGAPGVIAIVMGVLTGVAGGVVRDVLSSEVPLVLRAEIYATAAVLGATVYVVSHATGVADAAAMIAGLLAALVLRLAAIRWHLSLPIVGWARSLSRGDPQ